MTKKEKLNKIQEVIEESLGLTWIDRLVYNYNTKCYHTANGFDFCKGKATYIYLIDDKKKTYMARVVVDNESFKISINGTKVDASAYWKELLNQETITTITK